MDQDDNMKGQVAIESLFLILVVLTAAIFILGLYSNTHDGTVATSIARTELTTLANSMDEMVLIKKVSLERTETLNTIIVVTDPPTIEDVNFGLTNLTNISSKISDITRLSNISFKIN